MKVSGALASWSSGQIVVGDGGTGVLTIENHAVVTSTDSTIGLDAPGRVIVTSGGQWNINGGLYLGQDSSGMLTIENGGVVRSSLSYIGVFGGRGEVLITGAGSYWAMSNLATTDSASASPSGVGVITISDGGTLDTRTIRMDPETRSAEILNIGAPVGAAPVAPGNLVNTASPGPVGITFGNGTGAINFNHTSNSYVFAPIVSGPGSLNAYAGATILTGANAYTGGTNVYGGVLMLSGAGTFGGPSGRTQVFGGALDLGGKTQAQDGGVMLAGGAIQNGVLSSAIDFDIRSGSASATLAGAGGLVKTTSGTAVLSGVNTYAGATIVNGGTLSVNGSIVSSPLTTVNAGGALGGNGFVGATLINGGVLAPGNSIGLLSVQGNLTFTPGSTYLVEVSPGNADRVNVAGLATLGGATVNAAFAPGGYVAKQYTILNAARGISGVFAGPVNSNLPVNFASSLSYDANDAYLDLALHFEASTPTSGVGLNRNQQSVADALTRRFNRAGGIPMAFGALTPAGLTQVSGEVGASAQQTSFDAMNLFLGVLTDPFVAGRGDIVEPGAAPAPAGQGEALSYAPSRDPHAADKRAAAAIARKAAPTPILAPTPPRWSVWAAGFGGSQTTGDNGPVGSNAAVSRIYATAVGADYHISPDTIAGFAIAGGATNFSVANSGSGHSDLFQAGAFVRHSAGPAYVVGALAYGRQDITTDRAPTVGGVDYLHARFNANAFSGRIETGYRFATPWLGVTPYAAGQFTAYDAPGYGETARAGADMFALNYAGKNVTAARSELGLRADQSFDVGAAMVTLRGRAAWAHDFHTERSIAATFQTLPGASFVVDGAAQAPNSALLSLAAEARWANGFSLAAAFEGEFSDAARTYAGKGVLRYQW